MVSRPYACSPRSRGFLRTYRSVFGYSPAEMDPERPTTDLSRRGLLGAAGGALAFAALPAAARAASPQKPANPGPGLPATTSDFALALSTLAPQITGSTGSVALGAVANMPVLAGQA